MILVFRQSVSVTRARKTLFEFCWQRHPRTNIKTKNALTPDSISRMQPGEPNRSVRTARTGTCRTFPPRERWQAVSWWRKIGAKGFQSWRIWRIDSLSSNNWNMNASATQMGPLGSLDNVQLSSFSNLKLPKVIELHLMGISASQKACEVKPLFLDYMYHCKQRHPGCSASSTSLQERVSPWWLHSCVRTSCVSWLYSARTNDYVKFCPVPLRLFARLYFFLGLS